jgi:cytochrome c biogenesis protein CcmG, thiol:disulfide interchange protein DsbE
MWRYILPLAIFLLLMLTFWRGLALDPGEVPSPLVGKPVPAFVMESLRDGESVVSDADLRGRVSLLNVWGTWCPGCHEEHHLLMRLAEEEGVSILGLNYRDDRQAALRWLSRVGDPYLRSGYDPQGRVALDWGVYGAPETFVVDHRGIIRHKHIGPLTEDIIERRLLPMLRRLEEEMHSS